MLLLISLISIESEALLTRISPRGPYHVILGLGLPLALAKAMNVLDKATSYVPSRSNV